MAGHSAWKNIQHRKNAQDAKRGKIFTKIAKEITVAARISGGDPDSNPRLRLALTKARAVNMPKDNVDRAIKRGTGDLEGVTYVEKTYEGYGPGGVAILVQCLTDNLNRTISEVRHAFTKFGGNMGTEGSVSYLFKKKGSIVYDKSKIQDYDKMFEIAIEHGAEDVSDDGDVYEITSAPEDFETLKSSLDTMGIEPLDASIGLVPDNYINLDGDKAQSLTKLIDTLEDNDDVQNIYHNAELPD